MDSDINTGPLISVVIPVYKVEQYIDRCMQSVLSQSYSNLEIILVDDGSPDRCGDICEEYKEKDSRIKVIHKENGGLSSARNAGMRIATGKYIGFVDSDDDIEQDMFEKMCCTAETNHVDFVMADYIRIAKDKKYLKTLDIEGGYYDRNKIVSTIFPQLIMKESIEYGPLLSVWHCLYRREFLEEYGIQFDDEVRWSEDNIFSSFVGYHCSSFYYMKSEGLYHYYNNPGTITTAYKEGAWNVYCKMNDHLKAYFGNVQDYDFSRQLKLHMIYYACNCISQTRSLAKNEATEVIRTIVNDRHLIDAFHDFVFPDINWRLKTQLQLMKHRIVKPLVEIGR